MTGSIWDILGIEPTDDQKTIRRAYATKLRTTNPEDDPEGFQALRGAYERAMSRDGVGGFLGFFSQRLAGRTQPQDMAEDMDAQVDGETDTSLPDAPPPDAQPPDAQPNVREAHAWLQDRLNAALCSPYPDPYSIGEAYREVIESPAMALIDVQSATEYWLAWLIAERAPASDGLIAPARARFNWDERVLHAHASPNIQRVLERNRSLQFLAELRREGSEFHAAYYRLTSPPVPITVTWRMITLVDQDDIIKLLKKIREDHPDLIDNLNRETVARWDEFLVRPHLSSWDLWFTALSPFCLTGWLAGTFLLEGFWHIASVVLVLPVGLTLGAIMRVHAIARPAQALGARFHRLNPWIRFGWILAFAMVLAVGGQAPAYPALVLPVMVAVGVLSAGVTVWAGVMGKAGAPTGSNDDAGNLFIEFYLIAWWGCVFFTMPLLAAIQMSQTLMAASSISAGCHRLLFDRWLVLKRSWRIAWCLGLLVLTAASAAFLFNVAGNAFAPRPWPLAEWHAEVVGAVAFVTVMHRPLAKYLVSGLGFWKLLSVGAVAAASLFLGLKFAFVAGGAVLLFWVAVTTTLVLVEEMGARS